ncbi:hypothetical protein ABOM_005846 [Aspergillus bombycis]|uniref:Uncharacterized protein n=1 Tax=Aspergillus bombycis TaxID=109264 RepID=A0A1F8A0G2_9EURO|nr:hypothetical protein ABOM_005846 [Aspergillus bombycis]OGM45193.1 hypothetical protein ABOM_005846 [Aspergillus bombycis]
MSGANTHMNEHPSGGEGAGHISDKTKTSFSSANEFSSLREQKGMAERNFLDRRNRELGEQEGTCATEDHSFMTKKPGGSDTLPGWEKAKGALGNM